MRIGVLGTGAVGRAIATKLRELGHDVLVGSRSAGEDAVSFADAAAHGEVVFNCTAGVASIEALRSAGSDNLAGKVLVDVANPLDFSQGMPPSLSVAVTDSLGEQIQREFPETRVVKALNTVNNEVMVDPGRVPGAHHLPIGGNDADAKSEVVGLLETFGWPRERILDLGDITAARAMEAYLLLWVRLLGTLGTPHFNVAIAR